MSSYLDNLVLRTLDLARVAQPRLASAFESAAVPRETATPIPVQGESPNSDQARPADGPRPLMQELHTTVQVIQTQPEDKKGTTFNATRAGHDSKPIEKREVTPVLPVAEVRAAVFDQNKIERKPESPVKKTNAADAKEVEIRTQSKRESTPIVADVGGRERDSQWRKLEPRVRQIVRDELPPVDPSHKSADREVQVVQPRVVSAPSSKHEAHAPALPTRAVVSNPPLPSVPAAPEITVTIGRVDVRAVASPAAQSSRRDSPRPTSPTSLDQYLKGRSEGRR